jgi:hypothetical protein
MDFAMSRRWLKPLAALAVLCLLLWFFAPVALGAWTTFDYGLCCTKCLRYRHVIEQRFLGIKFHCSTSEWTPGANYTGIFGQPCDHIVRGGGCGRSSHSPHGSVRCGFTADGSFLRPRIQAVALIFELAGRLGDNQLARDSFKLIDRLMPPDAQSARRPEIPRQSIDSLWQLLYNLERVRTVADWQSVLQSAKEDFRLKRQLPGAD